MARAAGWLRVLAGVGKALDWRCEETCRQRAMLGRAAWEDACSRDQLYRALSSLDRSMISTLANALNMLNAGDRSKAKRLTWPGPLRPSPVALPEAVPPGHP